MSLRNKLRALHKPRPNALPDGAPTDASDVQTVELVPERSATPPHTERTARRATVSGRERPPRAPRSERVPPPEEARPTSQRSGPSASESSDRVRAPIEPPSRAEPIEPHRRPRPSPPSRPHAHSLGDARTTVVRAGDFAKWRARRNEPLQERVVPLDDPAPAAPLRMEREAGDGQTPEDKVRVAKMAHARGQEDRAAALLEAALVEGLDAPHWWPAARLLAELSLRRNERELARELLETLVTTPSTDPWPLLELARLVADEDAERSESLRAQARRIAPWL